MEKFSRLSGQSGDLLILLAASVLLGAMMALATAGSARASETASCVLRPGVTALRYLA